MNISDKDKKTLTFGAYAVAAILVMGYVLIPLGRRITQSRSANAPNLARVEALREMVSGRDSLLARRDMLVKKMGSLDGTGQAPKSKPPTEKPEEKPDAEAEAPPVKMEEKPDTEENSVVEPEERPGTEEKTDTEKIPDAEENADPEATPAEKPTAKTAPPVLLTGLAAYLDKVAAKSGVKIKNITPRRSPARQGGGKHFKSVGIGTSLECDIDTLTKLLHALEQGERFVRVERLNMKRDFSKGNTMNVDLEILAYESGAA